METTIRINPTVDTSASRKCYERGVLTRPMPRHGIDRLKLIPWSVVSQKLVALNKDIMFTTLPDGKVAIGLKVPSKVEIDNWERARKLLSVSEQDEVKKIGQHQGPRPFLVAASMGYVAPYTDIITSFPPRQIVCRSLKSILTTLVKNRAFTWSEAEREFQLKFNGANTHIDKKFVDVSPKIWAEQRPVISLSESDMNMKPKEIVKAIEDGPKKSTIKFKSAKRKDVN